MWEGKETEENWTRRKRGGGKTKDSEVSGARAAYGGLGVGQRGLKGEDEIENDSVPIRLLIPIARRRAIPTGTAPAGTVKGILAAPRTDERWRCSPSGSVFLKSEGDRDVPRKGRGGGRV